MGLDTVELVMAIEDEFDFQIPNEDASRLESVGDMLLYIVEKQHIEQEKEDEIWNRLKNIVISQLGVKPEQVTRDARFVKDLGAD